MGFWNEYNTDFGVVMDELDDAIAAAKKKKEDELNGGGTASANTTPSGGLRVDSQNSRQKQIADLSESQIQVALRMGILTPAEVDIVKGPGYSDRFADNPWGSAENKIQAQWTASPPAFFRSTLDSSESPTQALKGLSSVSGEPYGKGPVVNGGGGYTGPGPTGSSAGGGASRTAGTGGGGSSATAAPAPLPPPPVFNSAPDLAARGAIGVPNNGGTAILNGSQYRNPGAPVQIGEKQWQNVGTDGRPTGAIYSSAQAANLAKQYVDAGVAMTSRFGNSPAAKAASAGGFQQTVQNPLFPLIGLDQSIAAGATKGTQAGDILGTISSGGKNFYDITQGGISAGGGLTPVGNSMNPYDSFTGQMANGDSVGMSSILGNSGVNTQYWLSQMSGIPPSEIAKLKIDTPEEALQFQQYVETARKNGTMPNFASLYALNEPSGYQGAGGGTELKWAPGQASSTPYDTALAGFMNQALGSPDLAYLPNSMPQQNLGGTVQIGNTAYGPEAFQNPLDIYGDMANGGKFWTDEPISLIGEHSGMVKGRVGEQPAPGGGYMPERVTIDPMKDVQMGRERNPYSGGGNAYAGGQNPMHTMPYGGQGQRPQMPQFGDLWSKLPMGQMPPQWQSVLDQWKPQMQSIYNSVAQKLNGQNFADGGEIMAGDNFNWAPTPDGNDLAQADGLQGYLAGQDVAPEWLQMMGLWNPDQLLRNQLRDSYWWGRWAEPMDKLNGQNFASGGEIYAGNNKGFQQQYNPNDQALGYPAESPYDPGVKNATFVPNPGTEFGGQMVYTQQGTTSGQPNQLKFTDLSPTQMQQFDTRPNIQSNRYEGQISAAPVAYQNMQVGPGQSAQIPVYDVAGGKDYSVLGPSIGYDYKWYNNGGQPVMVRVPKYDTSGIPGKDQVKQMDINAIQQALQADPNAHINWGDVRTSNMQLKQVLQSGNKQAMLAALYDLDPKAAMLMSAQLAQQGAGGTGDMSGVGRGTTQTDQEIQNEAMRRRQYDIQARNYSRAGLPSPTIIDIPRQTWTPPQNGSGGGSGGSGANQPPWGSAQAPYQEYGLPVQNGYALPFGYEPGSPWFNRGNQPNPGGTPPVQLPQPGQNWTPWWTQIPDWIRGYQPAGAAA